MILFLYVHVFDLREFSTSFDLTSICWIAAIKVMLIYKWINLLIVFYKYMIMSIENNEMKTVDLLK